ncbi:MAG TPA: type VI secretion system tip protein TssI/VgrG [Byssovorax sp.]|jgi:type VI secretion system secreted protein VgrG
MHKLDIDGIAAELSVVHFSGFEALGEMFAFDVSFVAAADVAFGDVTGKPARLTIDSGPEARVVAGVVVRLEVAAPTASRVGYRVTLHPSAHALRLRRTSRIFQELAVPDIAKKVLDAAGVPAAGVRVSLVGSYTPRTYCVQYRESDWDFLSRLFEDEGIHTYFEHGAKGDVLVIADGAAAHAPITGGDSVPFRPDSGALHSVDCVSVLTIADELRAGKATVRDYDFKRPSTLVEGTQAAASNADLEVYDHPGGFTTAGDATTVATHRLEELQSPTRIARGSGGVARMSPGATFKITDHPSDGFAGPWLVTRVEHRGSEAHFEGGGDGPRYANDFDAVPSGAKLRPARLTRKPLVYGVQTATVVGPSGEEIQVDSFGRVRVQFHWDRAPKSDSNTCWIRVAQPWAGPAFGAMFIPRVGHEVVVAFEDGDPDRPLVTGSVYHGTNVLPYALPGDKTKSTLKSSSSPGGDGFNELRFEDKAGSEEIYLHAQKDLNAEVLHDESRTVGHDAELDVAHDRTKTVGHDETITVSGNETIEIGVNLSETVGADATLEVGGVLAASVGGAASLSFSGALTQIVGDAMTLNVTGDVAVALEAGRTEQIKKSEHVSIGESFSMAIQKDSAVAVDGSSTEDVGKDKTVTVASTYTLSCGDAKVTVKKNGDIEIQGKQITITGSGPVKVKGSKLEVSSDGAVKVQAGGSVKVSGGSIDMN